MRGYYDSLPPHYRRQTVVVTSHPQVAAGRDQTESLIDLVAIFVSTVASVAS
jgi:hypothetical protein